MKHELRAVVRFVAIAGAAACSAFSGYDPSRYTEPTASSASADPETAPLAQERRPRMLDPRSPLDAGRD